MSVIVYGATGWTGTLVCRALDHAGVRFSVAGRDASRLQALSAGLASRPEIQVVGIDDAGGLRRALRGARVVVSCVGPYLDFGEPVVDAALDAGCGYVDASGEYSFLSRVADRYDRVARERGLTFCPGLAAKGALGDWGVATAAATFGAEPAVDEAAIAYAHGLREYFQPSSGSVLSAAGQGFLKPQDEDGRSVARLFEFAPPFGRGYALLVPGAEDVSLPRHLRVRAIRSYLSLAPGSAVNAPWARASVAWMPWIPHLSQLLRRSRGALDTALGQPREERTRDSFSVAVEVTSNGATVRMGIGTRDAYAVTADIVCHGVRWMLDHPTPAGVISPSMLCDPSRALAALAGMGAIRVHRFVGAR